MADDRTISNDSKRYGEAVVRVDVPASIVPLVRLLRLVVLYRFQREHASPDLQGMYQGLLDEVTRQIRALKLPEA